VHAYLDGVMVGGFSASQDRSDLASSYPGFGTAHAFGFTVPASAGPHTICVFGINTGLGSNVLLGCLDVTRQ
jgi:hypothetical protein